MSKKFAEKQIIFYENQQSFLYFSNFVEGFIRNANAANYVFKWESWLTEQWFEKDKIPSGCLFFRYLTSDNNRLFCIDINDTAAINSAVCDHVDVYFKVNMRQDVLYPDNVVACSPCYPSTGKNLPRALFALAKQTLNGDQTLPKQLLRLKHLYHSPSENLYRALRKKQKQYAAMFVTGLYSEKVHNEHNEFRYELVKKLRSDIGKDSPSLIGLVANDNTEKRFKDAILPRVKVRTHINNMASSQLNIYVRGVHDCISFKFPQLMAMGGTFVGQKILNQGTCYDNLPYAAEYFNFESVERITSAAQTLLNKPELISTVSKENAEYYDAFLSPEATARSILAHIQRVS